jgi:hypothetical protein
MATDGQKASGRPAGTCTREVSEAAAKP